MSRTPSDPRMCCVGYLDRNGKAHVMNIPESALLWAFKQGWSLVFRYRDDSAEPHQSNPRRSEDDGA